MRTVSLSNPIVQEKITKSFIPLKVQINQGLQNFPLDWPALKQWRTIYLWMGGPKTKGITGCSVVSPDLKLELANTGSALVWELFDSIAYNPLKFATMLDNSLERFQREQSILADVNLSNEERRKQLGKFHAKLKQAIREEGKFHLPPPGFSIKGAADLFRLSGDLKP
ncbi:MAG: hypothetical protein IAF58_09170 [Leptolyngbya sp.]|nr:hypothetical protein [Candidatus Melainabacteria bacterium]